MYEMCGLDGYVHGMCDLAMIERLDAKSVDVILFDPATMTYSGVHLSKVPLSDIGALGFAGPLAEARAGALACTDRPTGSQPCALSCLTTMRWRQS